MIIDFFVFSPGSSRRGCIVVNTPNCGCGNPSSILGLDIMLRKVSMEGVRKAATVRKTTTYLYCCITNPFTLAYPPLSSIKYDTKHLMMLGSSWLLPM